MHLEHSFSVTAGIEDTWRAMLDPERMARCIPGAAFDSVKNGVASGAVRVRLGAIGPTYRGTAQVVDKDDEGHRAIVEAKGGSRSNGDASVRMIVTLSAFGDSTNVMLQSDVQLTGRTSELESQVISDAGDRLCRQVAARLNDLLASAPRREAPPAPPPAAEAEPVAAAEPVVAAEPPAEAEPVVAAEPPAAAAPRRPSPYPRDADQDTAQPEPRSSSPEPASAAVGGSSQQSRLRTVAPVVAVVAILLLLRRRRRRRRRRHGL